LVLSNSIPSTLLLHLLLGLPRRHELLGVNVDLWGTAWTCGV
jgi:hypothetical protein